MLSTSLIYSQNKIFIGTQSFFSTPTWRFKNTADPNFSGLNDTYSEISIAKGNNVNMLLVTTSVFHSSYKISGPVIVYLKSGKAISINTIRSRDFSDGSATTIFTLTLLQLKELMKSDISSIRYSKSYYSIKEGVTANNTYEEYAGMSNFNLPYYNTKENQTSADIEELFN
jgi:hypothetical protein